MNKADLDSPSGLLGNWLRAPWTVEEQSVRDADPLSTRTLVGNLRSDPPYQNFPNPNPQPVKHLLLKALDT